MGKFVHTIFVALLTAAFVLSVIVPALRGCSYYTTPLTDLPYHPDYERLKPTGIEGHGYGIIGTAMMVLGVALYSARKRSRRFVRVGKIKNFLEFHIFLCLAGPALVTYHTTFKFGGIVAVSFWCMIAVVISGIIGRYLYAQIPKGIQGNELSIGDLQQENSRLSAMLREQYGASTAYLEQLEAIALPKEDIATMSVGDVLGFFFLGAWGRAIRLRSIHRQMATRLGPHEARAVRHAARRKAALTRRIAFLQQFKRMFYHWHVVHLPFAIVMFIILCVHVAVALAFGYTWIW